eukprot:CAMPEP_0174912902 /NCGR_PEP_ID=MMETSP0167-20121228/80026_1 /TAXON_ID=38298 /ORGANISM="Rhodella maculata, Strain CCMP736" /LENGTH=87 /DNA_ID=CAMNT_0016157581 /DNA_START=1493 /DNA_END=1756 /DNA_ORIENTATION=+
MGSSSLLGAAAAASALSSSASSPASYAPLSSPSPHPPIRDKPKAHRISRSTPSTPPYRSTVNTAAAPSIPQQHRQYRSTVHQPPLPD